MKKTYIILLLTGILFTQCESLLDVDAENAVSGDVLNTEEDFETYLTGTYYNLTGISDRASSGGELLGGDFIMIPELLSRVVDPGGINREYAWQAVLADDSYNDFINKTVFVTNGRVEANWLRAYETINQANHLIANIDRLTGGEKDRIHGEALAIRGIIYFEMAQLWGPQYFDGSDSYLSGFGLDNTDDFPTVIIRTEPISAVSELPTLSESDVNTLAEVYDQAQSDLEAASALLDSYGTNGTRLSYYACQAYLAKLHLQKREFADAAGYADEVISSGAYSLVSSPLLAFNNTSNSSEDIFAIQQTLANNVGDNSAGAGLTAFYSSLEESGLGVYRVWEPMLTDSTKYHNSPYFAPIDIRGTVNTSVDSTASNGDVRNDAYYTSIVDNLDGILSTTKFTSSNYVLPVVRLAEMYLIRAESDYMRLGETVTTQPVNDLNAIRTRAGLSSLTVADFNGNDGAFLDSLLIERTREFMHEGMLLEDLKRWGGFAGSKANTNFEFDPWNDTDFADPFNDAATPVMRLPIPRSERDTWN